MSTLRERLLELKSNVYPIEVGGEKLYYRHLRTSDVSIVMKMKDLHQDAAIFACAACDEKGDSLFTIDEIEAILELPSYIIKAVVTAAITVNEKKQPGN